MPSSHADFDAVIFDLDGVITETRSQHARAWKQVFDRLLASRGGSEVPFSIETEYYRYVDGKPRHEGVRSFLAARRIELPEGDPADPPGLATVCAIGNAKNRGFRELLEREGVHVYPDARSLLDALRQMGKALAVVTSSRNGARVLEAGGLEPAFDVRLDGNETARRGLAGKPAPDTFLAAARDLSVEAARAVVVEDAVAGVRAGRAGGFGLVIGVDRTGHGGDLAAAGADRVVRSLDEWRPECPA